MGPFFVVLDHPPVRGLPNLCQIAEEVQIQHFVPVGPPYGEAYGSLSRIQAVYKELREYHLSSLILS